jgi:hypothetical protein
LEIILGWNIKRINNYNCSVSLIENGKLLISTFDLKKLTVRFKYWEQPQ